MGKRDDEVELFLREPRKDVRLSGRCYFSAGFLIGVAITVTLLSLLSGLYLAFHVQIDSYIGTSTKDNNLRFNQTIPTAAGSSGAFCNIVNEVDRFDCWPEYVDATQAKCEARGCCWNPNVQQGTPYCYFPEYYNRSYMLAYSQKTSMGVVGHLQRITKSPYPNDSMSLRLEISVETNNRLHIKIYDPKTARFEVPIDLHKNEESSTATSDFDIKLSRNPFGITIRRVSTGNIMFDSNGTSPLIFADQFLQIGTKLAGPNIYGLGEHRSSLHLDINLKKIVFWNKDQPPEPNLNLYGSHPFFMNLDRHNNAHGVFLLNSNAMEVVLQPYNRTGAVTYRSLGGILDFYVFSGPTPDDVVKQYVSLIGKPFLPPFWSLGFHMCKWGYFSSDELKRVIQRNRAAKMPYDVQWNDIDYMTEHLDWTFDKTKYAGLPDIVTDLHNNGQRYVIIVDPGISNIQKSGTYPSYDEGAKAGVFVRADNGSYLVGRVWPGPTVFPDFFNLNTTKWWYNQAKAYHDVVPYDGLWIDMNEPSNFVDGSAWGCTSNSLDKPPFVPPTIDGGSLKSRTVCPSARHSISSHYNLHNMYGLSEIMATNTVLKQLRNKRSFIITRSSFPSSGQYGGHWLGDNLSNWTDLYYSIPGILNFQMFGIPFVGTDICGFRGETTPELCTRWMQLGAFYPFMRNHNSGKTDQDPAAFDVATQDIMRSALEMRYRLLPFLYTLLYHSHVEATPVLRPLFFQYWEAMYNDAQLLWGSALLITPVLEKGARTVRAYIPTDVWYDFYNMTKVPTVGRLVMLDAPLDKINVHVRGGSIIPTKPAAVTTTLLRAEKFSLLVALYDGGTASGDLYWDDGESLDPVENNLYSLVSFSVAKGVLESKVIAGNYKKGRELYMDGVTVMGVLTRPSQVTLNGKTVTYNYNDQNQVLTVSNQDVDLLQAFTLAW